MPTAGKYELLDRIAKGGMAELFRARALGAEGFTKVLAIKRILPSFADEPGFADMLIDEAKLVANLSHPNVVQVFELGKDEAGYFIAMEFVNGPNLGNVLKRLNEAGRPMGEAHALDVVIQMLQGLEHAHALTDSSGRPLNIVHRDVSPQNVLVAANGAVKLSDFGIAKAAVRSQATTQMGNVKGKVPYMSPEQARGLDLDGRSDLFAAGLILWECLAGQRCYVGDTDLNLMRKVAAGQTRTLESVGVKTSPELQRILDKALQVDREKRYRSAGEMAHDLMIHHRKTYPEHTPGELSKLVSELFKAQLDLLAERLRKFETGQERPAGTIGMTASTLATNPGVTPPTTPLGGRRKPTVEPALSPAVPVTPNPERTVSGSRPRITAAPLPKPVPDEEFSDGPTEKAPRPLTRPNVIVEFEDGPTAPRPAPKRALTSPKAQALGDGPPESTETAPKQTAEEMAGIAAALEQANAAERKAKKEERSGKAAPLVAVVLFALALGGAFVGLSVLNKEEPPPGPPPAPAPLAAAPKPPPEKAAPPVTSPGASAVPSQADADALARAQEALAKDKAASRGGEKKPAKAFKPGTGYLDLACKPECDRVEIDGKLTPWITPARGIELSSGEHRLRVANRMLNLQKFVTIEIEAQQRTSRTVNLVLGP